MEDKYRSDEIERVRRSTLKTEERRDARFPQIKNDFERIQLINAEVLQSGSTLPHLNYRRIAEAAAEVNKRATRLKSNLFGRPANDAAKQVGAQTEKQRDLKSLLISLDNAISRFVHNPIFENTKIVNPQDSTRAHQDLESIIKLSREVNKRTRIKDQ